MYLQEYHLVKCLVLDLTTSLHVLLCYYIDIYVRYISSEGHTKK